MEKPHSHLPGNDIEEIVEPRGDDFLWNAGQHPQHVNNYPEMLTRLREMPS